jgi:RNA polymerase sigma factor (sigma-70 family)
MTTSPMSEVTQHLRSLLLLPEGADLTDGQLLEYFISRREPAALEALVRRHGPMVWGVCRRVLGSHHDAEDAFQATFLVLVRKAASVYPRAKVGNWLYGVAYQTALKARATRAKRRKRESSVTQMPEPAVKDQDLWNDLQPLLDQEVSRLPEKYRTVIVLCELEGRTVKEAARQLGCPDGTVASRLARGRAMLVKRLARHGLAVTGGTLAGVLSQEASASVPASVLSSTVKTVTLVAAGQAADTGVISGTVAALTEGVIKAMLLNKLMKVTAVLLVLAGLSGPTGLIYLTQAAGPPKAPQASKRPLEDGEQQKQSKDELARLQGTWRLVRSELDGVTLGEGRPEIKDARLVIDKSSVTMTGKVLHSLPELKKEPEDVKAVGTLTLDTTKNPKQIVLAWETTPWGTKEHFVQRGIYALDGADGLKLCFYFPGSDTNHLIPKELSANFGSKRSVGTWKRVPPSEKSGEKKKESEKPR